MSAEGSYATVVSPEELDALLSSTRSEQAGARLGMRPTGMTETGCGELAEIAKRFGVEQGRSLSTLHQTGIHFTFSHWEEISLRQFASAMLVTDRVAKIDLGVGGEDVYLLLNRPLVFGWMMLAFGARPRKTNDMIPSRPYTAIEERLIQRAAEDVSKTLSKAFWGEDAAPTQVLAIEDPAVLYNRSKRPHRVISLDVDGIGESGILRVALPPSLMGETHGEASSQELGSASTELADQLRETPIEIRVELGFTEVALCDLARLEVGDELKLERTNGGGLVIHVGDTPKFQAEPGKIGKRLAVRVTDVIQP